MNKIMFKDVDISAIENSIVIGILSKSKPWFMNEAIVNIRAIQIITSQCLYKCSVKHVATIAKKPN